MTKAIRPRVFVSRAIPEAGIDLIRAVAKVDVWPDPLPPPRAELLTTGRRLYRHRADAVGARGRSSSSTPPGLSCARSRRSPSGTSTSTSKACKRRGIACGHTPGVLTETNADTAWALLMAAARRITEAERYVRADRWMTGGMDDMLGVDVNGATIGIVGFGRIGQAVARRASGFRMRVLYHSRHRVDPEVEAALASARWVPFGELLAESDFVCIHVPLSPETRGLIDAAALARMKPHGDPRQLGAGPDRRHGRAPRRARGRHDPRGRARRDRPGAVPARPPAGTAGRLPHRARTSGPRRTRRGGACR